MDLRELGDIDWVVGVQVRSTPPTAIFGDVSLQQGSEVLPPTSITDLPEENISISPGLVVLKPTESMQALVLAIDVAAATKVTVFATRGGKATVTASTSILIRNGSVIPRKIHGLHSIVLALTNPTDAPELREVGPDKYIVSGSVLSAHLASFTRPIHPEPGSNSKHVVSVQFAIDESGRVPKTLVLSGQQPYADAALEALTKCEFTPFVIAGKKTRVNAIAFFAFGQRGEVTTSLTK